MVNRISKIILYLLFLGLVILCIAGYKYHQEIKDYRGSTICKYTSCEKFPKTTASHFQYYVDYKKYTTTYGRCPDDSDNKLRKFFVVNYSTINPNKIEVDFSREITDTTEIIKAGFSKEDLY